MNANRPNQALEPTTMSVMNPAEPGFTPAMVVAHLNVRQTMQSKPIHLTPRAQLFRLLSHDIRVLNQHPIATEEESALWHAEAQWLREKLHSTYKEIASALPDELDHYLDDADIRAKDAGYQMRQEAFVAKLFGFIAAEIQKGRLEDKA